MPKGKKVWPQPTITKVMAQRIAFTMAAHDVIYSGSTLPSTVNEPNRRLIEEAQSKLSSELLRRADTMTPCPTYDDAIDEIKQWDSAKEVSKHF